MIRVVALFCAFVIGWLLGSTTTTPPTVPVEQLPRESIVSAPLVTAHLELGDAPVREVITRTPVGCAECCSKDSTIDILRKEKAALEAQLAQTKQSLASVQMQLEWRPFLQELQQTLNEWRPDELQSVFARSKLFPQPTDLYLAQGLVRSGQLTPADLLEVAQEASRIEAEQLKAAAFDEEGRAKQMATFETLARGFIAKLHGRGLSLFAENFRAGVGLN